MKPEYFIYFFEFLAMSAVIMILFLKSIFHSTLLFLVSILSLAAIFGLSGAEFMFVTQIAIYAGGIVVLILFSVIITKSGGIEKKDKRNAVINLIIPILLFTALTFQIIGYISKSESSFHHFDITETGESLAQIYILPFEVSGLLLLITLIGAVIIATQKPLEQ